MTDPSLATIVTGVDDGYVTPLRVLIESLASSHGTAVTRLEMVVLHASLAPEKRDQLTMDAARVGLSLEFRAVRPTEHAFPVSGWVSDAVYLRLAMGEALPEKSRALYLDSDTIVRRDLRPLLARRLNGAPLAAVRDPQNPVLKLGIALPGWKELGLPGDREYFNSGVMLMDLDACRRCQIFERARDFLVDHPGSVRFWDQDALNWSVGESWQRLEREWNTFALTPLIERGDFVHYAESVMPLAELVADEATAAVLHFAGPDKPWRASYPPGPVLDLYRRYQRTITERAACDGPSPNA